jgi:hypothetical protein
MTADQVHSWQCLEAYPGPCFCGATQRQLDVALATCVRLTAALESIAPDPNESAAYNRGLRHARQVAAKALEGE